MMNKKGASWGLESVIIGFFVGLIISTILVRMGTLEMSDILTYAIPFGLILIGLAIGLSKKR